MLDLLGNGDITNIEVLYRLAQGGTTITPPVGMTVPTLADIVRFSNPDLETAVRSALLISRGYPILKTKITELTRLTVTRKNIDDLTGLAEATELTTLDLGDNEIDTLTPLSPLTNLTTLDLGDNEIEDITSLSRLTNLTSLDLADNQIQNVSLLTALSALETLDLRNNDVMDVTPLSTMMSLKTLYLLGNENLENIKYLVKLKEAGTTIDIPLPSPVAFRDENLKAALRTALTLQAGDPIFPEDMERLITFSAPNQSIVNLTGLETATNLTTLTLSNNQIVSLSPLSRLTSLTDLDLATNQIVSISSLSGLTSLTILNLSGNRISSLSPLLRLTSLTDMDLSTNQIVSLSSLSGLTSLTELLLLNNRIRDVLPLQNLSTLKTLNLLGNDDITNIEVLYRLAQGGTTITPPAGMTVPTLTDIVRFTNPDLETAVRSALRILRGYPILKTKITELTRLTVTRKNIDDLTGLEEATGLTTLDLGDNEIDTLTPLSPLTKLTNLDLADNQIMDLASLANLSELTTLNLSDNLITNLSGLQSLTKLQTLDLRDNDVGDVTPLKDLESLTRIYLRGNENLTNLEWLGALENLRADIPLPSVVGIPDTNLDSAVRAALAAAGNTVPATLPMSEELLESLETLTASGEEIVDLTGCEHMTGLTTLDLRNNSITDVLPLARLRNLEDLKLEGNPILDTSVLQDLANRGTMIDIMPSRYPNWDVNQDGRVDVNDLYLITLYISNPDTDVNGDDTSDAADKDAVDVDQDRTVDHADLLVVFENLDRAVNPVAPIITPELAAVDSDMLVSLNVDKLRIQLEMLRIENDGSLKYQQAIAFLQGLLAAARPQKTQLLANYPNPFNPETWIPYQLTSGSHVRITIYDTHGAVVRQLTLGHQSEGYYTTQSRAAYWDGRNNSGERVASGIYFYQLQADDVSLLRKMVILK